MKKNGIFVNDDNGTLVMTKAFYKKACIFGSEEYYMLRDAKAHNDGYTVAFKCDIAKKKTYGGLSFKTMEAYIKTQPDSEARLMEYEVKQIAEIKGGKYPLTKKWFLMTYPEFKKNEVSAQEQATNLAEAEKKMAEISALPARAADF